MIFFMAFLITPTAIKQTDDNKQNRQHSYLQGEIEPHFDALKVQQKCKHQLIQQ